jgi:hypothetical protein
LEIGIKAFESKPDWIYGDMDCEGQGLNEGQKKAKLAGRGEP